MSSNYLWKFYLENDAESFRRLLLEGTLPSSHNAKRGHAGEVKSSQSMAENGKVVVEYKTSTHKPKHMQGSKSQNLRITFHRQALKEYDSTGRSLIHLTSTECQRLSFLDALLKHPQIDLTHPDLESGWTALHRALYHGNISAARLLFRAARTLTAPGGGPFANLMVKIKDHSGEAPFELFENTIDGLEGFLVALSHSWQYNKDGDYNSDEAESDKEEEEVQFRLWRPNSSNADSRLTAPGGDEVYSFGSNKNLTLGFADGDDRQRPERLTLQRPHKLLAELYGKTSFEDLTAIERFRPLDIEDVQLSKFHSAILTRDPHSNLYICGFGHGGRLGFGDQQTTQFTYRNVKIGEGENRVRKVALGLDHTVVVLQNGEVWTWGSNKYGQLGYSTKTTSGTGADASSAGKGKKGSINGPYTEESDSVQTTPRQVFNNIKKEIFIGCAASRTHSVIYTADSVYMFGKNEGQLGILDSSDAKTLAIQAAPRKVAAGFLADHKILAATATDRTTAVMLDNNHVWIFTNYSYARVMFPTGSFPAISISPIKEGTVNNDQKSGNGIDMICVVTSRGHVYAADIPRPTSEGGRIQIPVPTRVWGRRNKQMAAKDVDVGQDGSIIICTESGAVWKRTSKVKGNEHAGALSKIAATGTGGTLATLHETRIRDHKFSRVPGLSRIVSVRSNKYGGYAAIRRDCHLMHQLPLARSTYRQDFAKLLCFGSIFKSIPLHKTETPHYSGIALATEFSAWLELPKLETRLSSILNSVDTDDFDMLICINTSKRQWQLPAHRAMFFGKCPILRQKNTEFISPSGSSQLKWGDGQFMLENDGCKVRLTLLAERDIVVPLLLLFFIYTDWNPIVSRSALSSGAYDRYFKIGRLFGLSGISKVTNATARGSPPPMALALQDPTYTAVGDVIIKLAEGEQIRLHSSILRVRSPFFETLYKGGANGMWLQARREKAKRAKSDTIPVDMKHIPLAVFEVVVNYMYNDRQDLFDNIRDMETLDEFLYFVLDVLAVANELMLDRLSTICQKLVGKYVNIRNASRILQAVDSYSQRAFRDSCLKYMAFNMEAMLENYLLEDLDDSIMEELDQSVQQLQIEVSPHSRSNQQLESLRLKYPLMAMDSDLEKIDRIVSYTKLAETATLSAMKQKTLGAATATVSGSPIAENPPNTKREESQSIPIHSPSKSRNRRGNEMMFEMDDDIEPTTPNSKQPDVDQSSQTVLPRQKKPTRVELPWQDVSSTPVQSGSPLSESRPLNSYHSPSTPWGEKLVKTPAVDLKEIMAQAGPSSMGKLHIANGASAPSTSAATVVTTGFSPIPKISQKEKRRQQSQQQNLTPTTPVTPEKKLAPWNTPQQAPRVALKDIFGASNAIPASSGPSITPQSNPSGRANLPIRNASLPPPSAPNSTPNTTKSHPSRPQQPNFSPSGKSQAIHQSTTTITSSKPPQSPSIILPSRGCPAPPQTQNTPPIRGKKIPTPSNDFPALPNPNRQQQQFSSPQQQYYPASPDLGLNLSLADIISQQEAEQDFIKGRLEKRALADIQAEQEFMDWWEKESERVRNLENGGGLGKGVGVDDGSGGGGGGRGGRGRGRGGHGRAGKGKGRDARGGAGGGGGRGEEPAVGVGKKADGGTGGGRGRGGGRGGSGGGGGSKRGDRGGGSGGKDGDGKGKPEPIKGIVIR